MRAHGIGDECGPINDDDAVSDWEDKLGSNVPPSNKRMYALRTNPNRLKSCRVCENCGKEFLSWKSFLEHGKCTSDDAESLVSSPASGDDDEEDTVRRGNCVWSKRKRSFRAKVGSFSSYSCPTREEEDLANCLIMLSNATVDPLAAEPEESCASASKDEERRNPMNFIAPLMQCRVPEDNNKAKGVAKGLFECKACKKVFNSHQALGGHRASHKKVKGCFAAPQDHHDDTNLVDEVVITPEEFFPKKPKSSLQFDHGSNNILASNSKRKSKVHECSICHRVFSSGQALGGHKRCHWITSNEPNTTTIARFQQFQDHTSQIPKFDGPEQLDLKLDLNFPASADDHTRGDASTVIYLQSWIGEKEKNDNSQCESLRYHHHCEIENDNNDDKDKNNNSDALMHVNVDDEADRRVKLAKFSELKDMTIGENSSPWLQVGISSATDVGTDP